jgi:GT2 family glycosyltransferase
MDRQPIFSIVIPTYQRPRQLAACLQSLTRLDYPRADFEVVVVDDGSELPTDEVVRPFRDQLDTVSLRQANAGPAAARNAGAARAQGTFLAFTDDDCTPAPQWLQALAKHFATSPDCAIGGRTHNALPTNPYATASQLLISYLYSYYNSRSSEARFFASNNLAFPASGFRAVGGFDTTYPRAAGEDRELCDRWLADGRRMLYAPDAVVYHAHALTLRAFWRQHFNYGRAACRFHRTRARRTSARMKVEPLPFYFDLVRYPFSQEQGGQSVSLAALLLLSQVANAAGFAWERVGERSSCL